MAQVPDIRKVPLTLVDSKGERINSREIDSYKLVMEFWTAKVTIAGKIGNRVHVFPVPSLEVFVKSFSPRTWEHLSGSAMPGTDHLSPNNL